MKKILPALIVVLAAAAVLYYALRILPERFSTTATSSPERQESASALAEAGSMDESANAMWYVNSGAYFYPSADGGSTVIGSLPEKDPWRIDYARSNPEDTDNGYHPQNIFRLITRSSWRSFREETYFTIEGFNKSQSPNRNQSNALLLFSHYRDENNLYYAGLRVDGYSVIKKKTHGEYYVLDEQLVFTDKGAYDPQTNPLLLPMKTPIGLRLDTIDEADGSVHLLLYADVGRTGTWKLVADGTDTGAEGGAPIGGRAFAGIRTDFMDVSFDHYSLSPLSD